MSKRKVDAKSFAQSKRKRRQWLTSMRMVRYGVNNFSRNTWLTVAATAVMTITLLIVFVTLSARNILADSLVAVGRNVDFSIYLQKDTSEKDVGSIRSALENLESVESAKYISPDQGRQELAEEQKSDDDVLDALNVANNEIPGVMRIQLVDINNTDELNRFTETSSLIKEHQDPDRKPSFSNGGQTSIQTIASWVQFAERVGLIASILFIGLSTLIVFNTIRMAIFNRKEEIQMMKLIGADRSFIRGPFVVEAVVYGFIAALVASVLGIVLLNGVKDSLTSFGISVQPTIDLIFTYSPFLLLSMILVGALIGVFSSLLATRKYLKI